MKRSRLRLANQSPLVDGEARQLFDVDGYRSMSRRTLVVRRVTAPTLVLGSTQPVTVVDLRRAAESRIALARRRSGGGAVFIKAGDPLWFDVWIPRDDVLHDDDVVKAAWWVGEWLSSALRALDIDDLAVCRAPEKAPGRAASLVCFGTLSSGEVTTKGRKVAGIAQWRCHSGSLFHCAVYEEFHASDVVTLLDLPNGERRALATLVDSRATGFSAYLRHREEGIRQREEGIRHCEEETQLSQREEETQLRQPGDLLRALLVSLPDRDRWEIVETADSR